MALETHLTAAFRQRPFLQSAGADMQYGMCVGFMASWVMRHLSHKAEGPTQRIAYLSTESAARSEVAQRAYLLKVKELMDIVQTTGHARSIDAGFEALGSPVRITSTSFAKYFRDDQATALEQIFAATTGIHNYYAIVLSFGDTMLKATSDNHVLGAYHSGGTFRGWGSHLYVFEPNFGEFKLGNGDIRGFFVDLAAAYMVYKDRNDVTVPKRLQVVTVHKLKVA